MNYKDTIINGEKANLNNGNTQSSLTKGQIEYILKQIELQQKGKGSLGLSDPYWLNQ